MKLKRKYKNTKITGPESVFEESKDYGKQKQECFVCFYLDSANQIIERRIISIGILNQSLVHPREVFAPAIELRANSIIVSHNHPSGNLEESGPDIATTNRLRDVGDLLGIKLLDHVIVSKSGFNSLANSCKL